jgi:predicted P-loop ATPase
MSTVEDIRADLEKNEKGMTYQTISNCMTVFQRDPLLKGAIRKNELSGKVDIVGNLGWHRTSSGLTDTDVYQIQWYLEKNYGLKNDRSINKALNIVASENKYHPIRDYLEQLEWDGQPRIDDLLPRYLGADKDNYTKEIMHLLMMAALRRIYEPGCKFEIMVCLVGGQGAGKSTFFRFLAINDEWFSDDLKRIDDEHVYRKMQGR